jgi:hypothetical protein
MIYSHVKMELDPPPRTVHVYYICNSNTDIGFGGLEVAYWRLVPEFVGSNPAEAIGFFGRKILSAPSFGEELKPSVPCRALRHVKDPKSDVEVATFGTNFSAISHP